MTATDGALGEHPEGLLAPGEALAARRRVELQSSAEALGAHRVVVLGYPDSGMAGTADNATAGAFCTVEVSVAAERLAVVLREEDADVLTVYDPHGGYGHPDHVQVHHVGVAAAALAGTPHVYEATVDRDRMRELVKNNPRWNEDGGPDVETFGLPAEEITTRVDVRAALGAKRAAMRAHASQVGDFGPFLEMPDEALGEAFGEETFRRLGPATGSDAPETSLPLQPGGLHGARGTGATVGS